MDLALWHPQTTYIEVAQLDSIVNPSHDASMRCALDIQDASKYTWRKCYALYPSSIL